MSRADNFLYTDSLTQPHSSEAERAVLGIAILDPSQVPEIMKDFKEEYFFSKINRRIYNQIRDLYNANISTDVVTVINATQIAGIFNTESEAKQYISNLAELVPSISNLRSYIEILRDKYLKRSRQQVALDILRNSSEENDVNFVLESAEQKIYELRKGRETTGLKPISIATAESYERLKKLAGPDREKYLGVPTGYRYLDYKLGRMGKSDLIILAARPGMGKTSFALNIATNVAMRAHLGVAIFSLEMSASQLSDRLISAYSSISSRDLRDGRLPDMNGFVNAMAEVSSMPIFVDDTANITVSEIKAKVRQHNQDPAKPDIAFIVIDYIQLMKSGRRIENRVQEMSEITRELKIMAKELNVPVMALSQLSRSAEKNGKDARAQLSDLRDSGSIEQDADSVLFIYRESYYDKSGDVDQTKADITIAKNRHGETGTIDLSWDGEHTRFFEVEPNRDE